MKPFDQARPQLELQYDHPHYDPDTGLPPDELQRLADQHVAEHPDEPRILTRAFLLNLFLTKARFAVDTTQPFVGKLDCTGVDAPRSGATLCPPLISAPRGRWRHEALSQNLPADHAAQAAALGINYQIDVSHIAPDWQSVLQLGFTGLRERVAQAGNDDFHRAACLVYDGAIEYCRRVGSACRNDDILALAEHAPQTLRQAFVMTYLFHEIAEYEGEEVRSAGWFDRLFIDFYRRDLAQGILSRNEAKELIKYFWYAFYAKFQGSRFGKNFCFGPDINELSYLGMEVYHEMNTVDPKLSVRVTPDTPRDFLELCAKNIRDGRNGIVMLNDQVVIEGLIRHGRTPEDAADYIPIGCYEPAVLGKEASISGATHIRLPKTFETFFQSPRQYDTFDKLFNDFRRYLIEAIRLMGEYQNICERVWPRVSPAPFLSASFKHCVETGKDYSEGGCDYNSTGCVVSYTAEVTDALAAVNYLVYQQRLCTLDELRQACRDNWQGHEHLQKIALRKAPKYGNNDDQADAIAVAVAKTAADTLNTLPNARNGHFFASIYGQGVVAHGKTIGALPNGRLAGTPVSKNMDACIGMDRHGITSLMNTVLKIDMRDFACGTCLDLMLHPSAVHGHQGCQTIVDIIQTFIQRGGSGLQFNIFDASVLREAQKHPEQYQQLQVRVCGWNSRFIDLSPAEQETFIRQADAIA